MKTIRPAPRVRMGRTKALTMLALAALPAVVPAQPRPPTPPPDYVSQPASLCSPDMVGSRKRCRVEIRLERTRPDGTCDISVTPEVLGLPQGASHRNLRVDFQIVGQGSFRDDGIFFYHNPYATQQFTGRSMNFFRKKVTFDAANADLGSVSANTFPYVVQLQGCPDKDPAVRIWT